MRVDIFSEVKVKSGVAAIIKDAVSNQGFFRQEKELQIEILNKVTKALNELYRVDMEVTVEDAEMLVSYSRYNIQDKTIQIGRMSVINYLTAYRNFLIAEGFVREKTTAEDVHAWACKAFKLACPNSFEKSVKDGKVARFIWDEESNKPLMNIYTDDEISTDEDYESEME